MNVNDVIDKAISIVGLTGVTHESEDAKVKQLYECANYVYAELTTQFVNLRKVEKIAFKDSVADYADFEETVREIIKVNVGGESKKFIMYPTYVCCEGFSGDAYVEYYYAGGNLQKGSVMPLPPYFTDYLMATGVACEFYYRNGYVDEAMYYKSRYENAVSNVSKKLRGFAIPVRRFIC